MGTITGTSGNDLITPHTATDYMKGQLSFVLGGIPAGGEWPKIGILVNGQWVEQAITVDAPVKDGVTEVVTVQLPNVPITSVGIQYFNDGVVGTEDRNLYVGSATLNGVNLPLAQGTYAIDGDASIPGQSSIYRNGTLSWSGSVVANAMAQSTTADSMNIDGGSGTDTVTYTGKEKGDFFFLYHSDGSETVQSLHAGFTDTLHNTENVLFDDGGDAKVDAAANTIDGGSGLDTLVLFGHTDQYHITHTATGFSIFGNGVNEWVTNVERLKFTNGYVALDINGHAGEAYRLYQAAFDRTPDSAGLGFNTHSLDVGLSLSDVAQQFITSAEFQSKYGNPSDADWVTLLYQNVLHRAPDQSGYDFHMWELSVGLTRAQQLAEFSESPENQANVIGQIQDGMFMTMG
jgi:hypothetical protein